MIEEKASQTVKVKAQLDELTKTQLEIFLKQNANVMVYSLDKMPTVDSSTMVYYLNVKVECQSVKQNKSSFISKR